MASSDEMATNVPASEAIRKIKHITSKARWQMYTQLCAARQKEEIGPPSRNSHRHALSSGTCTCTCAGLRV